MEIINEFLIGLVSLVYSAIHALYNIFLSLARLNLFHDNNSVLNGIIKRIYIVIGVVMLFFLAYSLLRTIVNPDSKDKAGAGKIITNILKAIIIIAIIPSAFQFGFAIQDALLEKNTIGKIILGVNNSGSEVAETSTYLKEGETVSELINNAGIDISVTIFEAFFYPYIKTTDENGNDLGLTAEDIENKINNEWSGNGIKYQDVHNDVLESGNFDHYKKYATILNQEEKDEYIVFNWVFALVAGGFCVYMLISYCLSLALRIVKLAFYEIIAPVPLIADIVPGKQGMFNKWLKVTLTTFIESLLRIAILFFMVYLIRIICSLWDSNFTSDLNFLTGRLVRALLIMGAIMFAKQAPQLISEITGIDSKNMSMGIKDKLAAGGVFTAGAVAGGALRAGVSNVYRNVTRGNSMRKKAHESGISEEAKKARQKEARKSYVAAITSGVGGFLSGGVRAISGEKKDFKSMRSSANTAADTAIGKAKYHAELKSQNGGNAIGMVKGHVHNVLSGAGNALGLSGSVEVVDRIQAADQYLKIYDDYAMIYENATYKQLDAQVGALEARMKIEGKKAMVAPGSTQTLEEAVKAGKAELRKAREESISKNVDAASYVLYQIVNKVAQDPIMADELKIPTELVEKVKKDMVIKTDDFGNKFIAHTTGALKGKKWTDTEVKEFLEGKDEDDVSLYKAKKEIKNKRVTDMTSVAYKEYLKRQDENKNKN